MRLVIIANPVAGGGSAYRSILDYVRNWNRPGWDIEIRETQRPAHAGFIAEELTAFPPDLVGICGGDGTINEVASRLAHPPFPIAILPAGTANVVARELRVPLHPVRALEIALARNVRHVDLGKLNAGGRRFLFVAGVGFDAFVVAGVNPGLKKKIGMAAYAAAIVSCLRNYSFPEFNVKVEGRAYTATSCLACNAKSYGGGLRFCPGADMADGLLDILILEGRRRVALGCFLLQAWIGRAATHDWVHRIRTRSLRVEGGADVLVQADGELAGGLPVEIGIEDRSFPLVIPGGY
jgi:YegS/Rv2252/BmrU family lipid kinase